MISADASHAGATQSMGEAEDCQHAVSLILLALRSAELGREVRAEEILVPAAAAAAR